jgi:formate hydrogenlyase subunit 4
MLSFILIILSAVFIPGIIIRTKSLASGRKGPGILQPIKDVWVLLRKGSVFSNATGFVFQMAPSVALATVICAAMLMPVGKYSGIISFEGDFVFFAYLLALGKFFTIIGALDTGSSFEGMGANREALYSMLVEPAFLLLLGTFAMFTGYSSFAGIFASFHFTSHYAYLIGIIGFYLLTQIAMIENSRLPVDDPKTHLELTMVHEVMVLDNSGFDMALIHIGTWLKFALFGSLLTNSIIPAAWGTAWQILFFLLMQLSFGIIIGLLESFRARNKMAKNPQFILTFTSIALIAFIVVLIFSQKIQG